MDVRQSSGRRGHRLFAGLAGAAVLAPAALLATAGTAAAAPAVHPVAHIGHGPGMVTAHLCLDGGGAIANLGGSEWVCIGGRFGGSTIIDM
jgi:hypothetical protein